MKKLFTLVVISTFSVGIVMAQSNEKTSATKTVSDKSQKTNKVVNKEQLKALEKRNSTAKRIDGADVLTKEQLDARLKERSGKAKAVKNEEK